MRHRDGGENETEGPPRADNDGPRLARPSHHQRRKAVQPQGYVAAHIPVKTARNVPQGSAQHQSGEQERQAYPEAVVAKLRIMTFGATGSRRNSGQQRRQRGALAGTGIGQAFEMKQSGLNVAAFHDR